MPGPLLPEELALLVARGCGACGRNYLRVRAIAPGTVEFLDGEPVSSVAWGYQREELAARVYRVECAECEQVLFERGECPRCGAGEGRSRALGSQHGLEVPAGCPLCGHGDLRATVEVRMHVDTVLGHLSRRVADAEPHEPGFHVVALHCIGCERMIADLGAEPGGRGGGLGQRCGVCGRSSLLKRVR